MASLKINRGTTYSVNVLYQKNGIAATLIGATVRFTMKPVEFDADTADAGASVFKNVTSGTIGGTATITLNPVDTATLTPGDYFYDIKVQEAGGDIYKLDEGSVTLDASPTNRLV